MSRARSSARGAVAALCCVGLAACAYQDYERDVDRTPVVDTGAGASIIMPGQTAPPTGGGVTPGGTTTQRQGPEGQGSYSGSGAPGGGGNLTMIGGSAIDDKSSLRIHEEPTYYKYLALPFVVLAAPFVAIAEAVRGEPEPGPELPNTQAMPQAQPQAPAPPDYETRQLEAMERELEQRAAQAPAPRAHASVEPPPRGAPATWKPRSIADELAELQRTPDFETPRSMQRPAQSREAPREALPQVAARPQPPRAAATARPGGLEAADGIVDRDEDGRVDQWIFREDGEIVRALYDDDGDGRPERTHHYDRETHRIARVEEDTDQDGTADSWTDFREGELFRRRIDADLDGNVDSWSYYRGEELTRHEVDTTGDGFRDRVSYYDDGEIVREEQDRDGDGRTDLTVHFGAKAEITRREEDTDRDGAIDTISHYEGGRLKRRELLDPSAAVPGGSIGGAGN